MYASGKYGDIREIQVQKNNVKKIQNISGKLKEVPEIHLQLYFN